MLQYKCKQATSAYDPLDGHSVCCAQATEDAARAARQAAAAAGGYEEEEEDESSSDDDDDDELDADDDTDKVSTAQHSMRQGPLTTSNSRGKQTRTQHVVAGCSCWSMAAAEQRCGHMCAAQSAVANLHHLLVAATGGK